MSALRSALDELASEDLERLADSALEADFLELEGVARRLEAERARRLAEIDRRLLFRRQEYISLRGWVAKRLRVSFGAAQRLVALARGLGSMPATRDALAAGEMSACAAHALTLGQKANPEAFGPVEEALVDAARALPHQDLRSAIGYWRQAADAAGAERDAERAFERRRLHVSRTFEGMVRVDGDLDPETGEVFLTALRAIEDADVRTGSEPDARTPSQRRADALGEMSRQWLDLADRPEVAGERPHVTLAVDLQALETGRGRCELEQTGPIVPSAARRILCDAGVSRVITRGATEILEVGRETRDGGETGLSNLALVCRPHHRAIHAGRFQVAIEGGFPVFRWPGGRPMEAMRAPPAVA